MKICIVKLSAMGDIIHSMIALQFIKKKLPTCKIDWIVEERFKLILENNPHIDNVLPINIKSLKQNKFNIFGQIKLLNKYAKNNYDIVIDAQGLIKSAIISKIVGHKIVDSKIIGFDKNSIREKFASKMYDEIVTIGYEKNVIDRNIKVLCHSFDIKVTKDDILNKKAFLYSNDNSKLEKIKPIIFVVGASKINKIYPKEKFEDIANGFKNKKIEVIWANDYEKDVALYLDESCLNVSICEKMSLDKLKSKIKNSALVIGGDTGPTHMAWALNRPSITIFGNTPQNRNTYITNINKVIKSSSCVDALKLDYDDFSIQNIDASEIVNMANNLLK
jgi:heptosyltransferase-1